MGNCLTCSSEIDMEQLKPSDFTALNLVSGAMLEDSVSNGTKREYRFLGFNDTVFRDGESPLKRPIKKVPMPFYQLREFQ